MSDLPDDLGVVVVAYNCTGLVDTLLRTHPWLVSPQLVVVDNSDDPLEAADLQRLLDGTDVCLLPAGGNVGFGAGMNRGVRALRSTGVERVLLLNPDAAIGLEELSALCELSRQQPRAMVSPVLFNSWGELWFDGGHLDLLRAKASHRSGAGDWLTAACLLVPLAGWDRVGGFAEDYFLYWEDVDLSVRWRHDGGLLMVADGPDAITATHAVGGTQPHAGKSDTYLFHQCRNRLLFARSNLPLRWRLWWLLTAPLFARQMQGRARASDPSARARARDAVRRGTRAGVSGR